MYQKYYGNNHIQKIHDQIFKKGFLLTKVLFFQKTEKKQTKVIYFKQKSFVFLTAKSRSKSQIRFGNANAS